MTMPHAVMHPARRPHMQIPQTCPPEPISATTWMAIHNQADKREQQEAFGAAGGPAAPESVPRRPGHAA